jgi:ribosome biogenesis GTPase
MEDDESGEMIGTVWKSTGSWYEVETSDGLVPSKARGKFRLTHQAETNPIAVGDRVTIQTVGDGTGMITEVHDRRNKLVRRAAGRRVGLEHVLVANVDFAWVVQSVLQPKLNPGFVDRFLVMAAVYNIPAGLIVNKIDLVTDQIEEAIEFWCGLYESIGYPVVRASALSGAGLDSFRRELPGRVTVLAGPSGVGKSSILNFVEPSLDLRTGGVSEKTRKGTHVTTNAAFYRLAGGGIVVDTPGLREFGVVELDPPQLSHYFIEFVPFVNECRYPNCTHDHEPDCAVVDAVDRGEISQERWASYLNILESIRLGEKDVGR